MWQNFKVTNSFTLENSFYGYDYYGDTPEGRVREFTAEDFQELGVEICRSIWEFRELSRQIKKELDLTKGWLKPKLLLEVTGMPAADRMKEEHFNKRKSKNPVID